MIEIIRRAFINILCNKGRMLLTLFGIAVGAAAVIITVSIGNAGSTAIDNEIDGLGMGGLSVTITDPQAPLTDKQLSDIMYVQQCRLCLKQQASGSMMNFFRFICGEWTRVQKAQFL